MVAIGLSVSAFGQSGETLKLNGPTLTNQAVAAPVMDSNEEFFAVGTLQRVRRTDTGSVRMALLDDSKQIQAFIAPTARLPLGDYVGQEVGISARTFSQQDDIAPYVMVEEIVPIAGANAISPSLLTRLEQAPKLQRTPSGKGPAVAETGSGVQQASAVESATVNSWSIEDEHTVMPATAHLAAACDDPSCDTCGAGNPSSLEPYAYTPGPYLGCSGTGCTGCASCTNYDSCTSCGTSNCCCGPPGWLWVRGEYLLWWADGMRIPALVTGSTDGTAAADAGVLGVGSTQVLYGNEEVLEGGRSGFRIRFGGWFGDCRKLGWEADYFDLGDTDELFEAGGDTLGNPIIARPFFNINEGMEDSELVSYPGIVAGSVDVASYSQFNGASARFRWNLCCTNSNSGCGSFSNCLGYGHRCGYPPYCKVDFSLGYKHLGLNEGLSVQENLVTLIDPTTNFVLTDTFETRNDFNGGEIGTIWEAGWNRWSLEMASKMAIGSTRHEVTINGSTRTLPGDDATGGLLAQTSNIGTYSQDDLSVIPELSTTLGFYLTPRLRFTVGYTMVYWSNVVRPGGQIDLDLDPDLIPPQNAGEVAQRPDFNFSTTDFWAQGLNVGLDLHW